MKLKKIASLMLAGVMAVSMLAGCNTTSTDPEQPTDPETPTTTGYSDVLAENLSDDAKKDYIAFEDNADDLAALEDALSKLSWTTTAGYTLPKVATPVGDWGEEDTRLMVSDFVDALDIENIDMSYQWMRDELMSQDELAVMDGSKCILQLRGVRPFLSDKYDITQHPNYKYTADDDPENAFDIEGYLKARLKLKPNQVCDVYEIDAAADD